MPVKTAAIILAAGDGTRMKSRVPKVCCEVLAKPMLGWVISACSDFGIEFSNICTVLSHIDSPAKAVLPETSAIAIQSERLGTGHAVLMCDEFLSSLKEKGISEVAVLCGDAPFIQAKDLENSLSMHIKNTCVATVLTSVLEEGGDYGRIIRKSDNSVLKIVEKKNATADEKLINEVNSGAYWFDVSFLLKSLSKLTKNTVSGEFYLTDLIELATNENLMVSGFCSENSNSILGANNREQLSALNVIAKDIKIKDLWNNGVDIALPNSVMIGPDVSVGVDTRILPGSIILGNTTIGEGCTIGPNSYIINCSIGDDTIIESSKISNSVVDCDVRIGPFAQLRPNCTIAKGVKIGNFVEVKNSTVGEKTAFAHLTYIGDSDFGSSINVGCGVVTVNYDGKGKYRTTVEDNAFIGCNSNLVAPVTVHNGAYVAAASTVTEDIDANTLVIGRVKLTHKADGALKYRKKK